MDAQQKDAQAWPLLLDLDGNISEPWGSNFFFVSKGSIFTSTNRTVLEGVTKGTVVELAEELGFSLGKLNYCLKALKSKGLIKIDNFRKNPNKINYIYVLTPKGISEKTKLTIGFMKRKMKEYDELRTELKK